MFTYYVYTMISQIGKEYIYYLNKILLSWEESLTRIWMRDILYYIVNTSCTKTICFYSRIGLYLFYYLKT